MRKKTYLKLKNKRKILRRKQRKLHNRLWANVKGLTKTSNIDGMSDEFIDICDKTYKITIQLKKMGYYNSDLNIKKTKIKKRAM